MKKEFTYLMHSTEKYFQTDDRLSEQYIEMRNEFENEFVRLNCELQNNRSDIHQMKDTLIFQEKLIAVRRSDPRRWTEISRRSAR